MILCRGCRCGWDGLQIHRRFMGDTLEDALMSKGALSRLLAANLNSPSNAEHGLQRSSFRAQV